MKDYYQILGIPNNAGKTDIKKAFRKLAFKYHPDYNPDSKSRSEIQFKQIKEAYDILIDDNKRRQYDSLCTLLRYQQKSTSAVSDSDSDIGNLNREELRKLIMELYSMGIVSPRMCSRGFGRGRCRRYYT
jgi:molecular chaperone DnaJ